MDHQSAGLTNAVREALGLTIPDKLLAIAHETPSTVMSSSVAFGR